MDWILKSIHVQDFIVGFSLFLASLNNRQEKGPEVQYVLKLKAKFSCIIGFL
jgi:hypothetical protein